MPAPDPTSTDLRPPGPSSDGLIPAAAPSGDWLKTRWSEASTNRPAGDSAPTLVNPPIASAARLGASSAGRVRSWVAFLTGAEPGQTEELRRLLRPRLIGGLILALLAEASYFSLYFGTDFITPNPLFAAFRLAAVAVYLALLLWLRRQADPSLLALRSIELLVVFTVAAEFAVNDYLVYLEAWAGLRDVPDKLIRFLYAYSCLNWVNFFIAYAVLIPNSWRRCLIVLGCLAAMPFFVAGAAWLSVPAAEQRPLLPILLYLLRSMLIGLVIAGYGAFRITQLREQAFEAKRLGQYQLKEPLGEGGMGTVYLAEHRLLKRPCAVKVIRPDQAGDPAQLRRFEREAAAMAGLKHWNTAEVFDYGRTPDGAFYYVMEFVKGLSLHELAKRFGPQPPGRCIHILRQVCAALREAHGQGLIHRDLKPSNVMLTRIGRVGDVAKLLDFGLVQGPRFDQVDSKLTAKGIILGTPDYLSPEQASGVGQCDGRSDLYSLGAVAYWLLTGKPPFSGPTVMHVIMAHLDETPAPPSSLQPVPADLEAVVLRCLAKAPADRHADVEQLDAALAACANAGGWTERDAELWWHEHGPTLRPAPASSTAEPPLAQQATQTKSG